MPGLGVPHCREWEPRPRAENRLFLEGGQGCSRVLTVGQEPALCSSQAIAFITEARPGAQMKVPESQIFPDSACVHAHMRACTHTRTGDRSLQPGQEKVCLDFQNVLHAPGPCAPGS